MKLESRFVTLHAQLRTLSRGVCPSSPRKSAPHFVMAPNSTLLLASLSLPKANRLGWLHVWGIRCSDSCEFRRTKSTSKKEYRYFRWKEAEGGTGPERNKELVNHMSEREHQHEINVFSWVAKDMQSVSTSHSRWHCPTCIKSKHLPGELGPLDSLHPFKKLEVLYFYYDLHLMTSVKVLNKELWLPLMGSD